MSETALKLKTEIEQAKQSVRTDTVQMTLGEIASMYDSNELNIHPEFQRLFRWTPQKKSDFIESLFINIPVPPAFVYENELGEWELVDGLQRVSTILEFMGTLRDPNDPGTRKRSVLSSTKYLPDLEGVVWNKTEDDDDDVKQLDKSLQLFFRRSRLDFQVLKQPSDEKAKFDLFQRLNRGGLYATEQEVRSCAMFMIDSEATAKLKSIIERSDFKSVFRVTEDQEKKQTDFEYVVRSLIHTYIEYDDKSEVQDFLDASIIELLRDHDIDEAEKRFLSVLGILNKNFGDKALLPKENAPDNIANRFSLRALEAIFVGISRNFPEIEKLDDPDKFVKDRITSFWGQPQVQDMSAPGLTGTLRLRRTIPFGVQWFNPNAAN